MLSDFSMLKTSFTRSHLSDYLRRWLYLFQWRRLLRNTTMLLLVISILSTSVPTQPLANIRIPENRTTLGTEAVLGIMGGIVTFAGAQITIPDGALSLHTLIRIQKLSADLLPPLEPGMVNITAGGGGYQFLPAGTTFTKPVLVEVPLQEIFADDKNSSIGGIYTYYWDEVEKRWIQLPKVRLDKDRKTLISTTTHFTTMINAILTAPDSPPPLQFNPNSIKDIAAVEPTVDIDLIQPPIANNQGTAELTYPIQIPQGRGSFSPQLFLSYSSARSNGWLGVGWDVNISQIEIDTRWGVPAYEYAELAELAAGNLIVAPSERFLLNGAALVPISKHPEAECLAFQEDEQKATQVLLHYTSRNESFQRVLFCAASENGVTTTHWEVTARDGTRFEYGTDEESRLTSYHDDAETERIESRTNTGIWYLRRVIDSNENVTEYRFRIDSSNGEEAGEPFVQKYLERIEYTSHPSLPATYRVDLDSDCIERLDPVISGRLGFKVMTRCRLSDISVFHLNQSGNAETIRRYELTYHSGEDSGGGGDGEGAFGKSLLAGIAVLGRDGSKFYEHTLDYTEPEFTRGETPNQPFAATNSWTVDASDTRPLAEDERLLSYTGEVEGQVGINVGGNVKQGVEAGVKNNSGCNVRQGGTFSLNFPQPELRYIDVNGDGISDRIWQRPDGSTHVIVGNADPDGKFVGLVGNATDLEPPLPYIGVEYGASASLGLSADCNFSEAAVNGSISANLTTALVTGMLADADGDGRTDLSHGTSFYPGQPTQDCSIPGAVCFGDLRAIEENLPEGFAISAPPHMLSSSSAVLLDANGAPDMRIASINGVVAAPIRNGPVQAILQEETPFVEVEPAWGQYTTLQHRLAQESEWANEMYRLDPVIRWDARNEGSVQLRVRARRKFRGGSDGVVVRLLHATSLSQATGTQLLGELPLPANNQGWHTIPGSGLINKVMFGESFLVIVDTLDEVPVSSSGVLIDEVELDIDIQYTEVCPLGQACRRLSTTDLSHRDATGLLAYQFRFPEDLRISELPRSDYWQLLPPISSSSANQVTGVISKTAITDTPVHVRIRCESVASKQANDGTICPMGTVLAEEVFEPDEITEREFTVKLPSPFKPLYRLAGISFDETGAITSYLGIPSEDGRSVESFGLGTLSGNTSQVRDINDHNHIVGSSTVKGLEHAFLWTPESGIIDFSKLIGVQGTSSWAVAINNQDHIAGNIGTQSSQVRPFVWTPEQGIIELPVPSPLSGRVIDINDQGQILGELRSPQGITEKAITQAVIWQIASAGSSPGASIQTILPTFGERNVYAMAINDHGQVVGYIETTSLQYHAYLWTPKTGMRDLSTLGGSSSRAYSINNRGEIVGNSETENGTWRSFLWSPKSKQLSPLPFEAEQEDQLKVRINNHGQILATTQETDGKWRSRLVFEDRTVIDLPSLPGLVAFWTNISSPLRYEPIRLLYEVDGENGREVPPSAIQWTPTLNIGSIHDVKEVKRPDDSPAIDLGTLGGTHSRALAINEFGQVTGYSTNTDNTRDAFVWTPTTGMINLNVDGQNTFGDVINNVGQIAGRKYSPNGSVRAFFWTPGEVDAVDLGTLGGRDTVVQAINDRGQVVGYSYTTEGSKRAFLWTREAGIRELPSLGGQESQAYDINEHGQIVGYSMTSDGASHAALWTLSEDIAVISLETLGGGFSSAYAINEHGEVVGESTTAEGVAHAFLWTSEEGMIDLKTLGGEWSAALAINELGEIVGTSNLSTSTPGPGSGHAFLWTRGEGMIDLDSLHNGYTVAIDINDRGQIVGNKFALDGTEHAFIWTRNSAGGISSNSQMRPIGGDNSSAMAINNKGEIIGDQLTHLGVLNPSAFIWRVDAPSDFVKQEKEIVLTDDNKWVQEQLVLYRVHPARQLVPFRTTYPGQEVLIRATTVNAPHPLIVTVTGETVNGELLRESVEATSGDVGATTETYTVKLAEPGLYYIRGYTEVSFDPSTSLTLTARLNASQMVLINQEYADLFGQVQSYADLNQDRGEIIAERGSPAYFAARHFFPEANIEALPSLAEALLALLVEGKPLALVADAGFLENEDLLQVVKDYLEETASTDPATEQKIRNAQVALQRTFLCCVEGTLLPNVPTNLLHADFGNTDYLSDSMLAHQEALEKNLVGEVYYSLDAYGGGHHGFFYGQFNGEEELTCISPYPCKEATAAPLVASEALAGEHNHPPLAAGHSPSAFTVSSPLLASVSPLAVIPQQQPDSCKNDADGDGILDCFDSQPCTNKNTNDDVGSRDKDGDGIPDCIDPNPSDPADFGSDDPDGDGIRNDRDNCPFSAGEEEKNGCSDDAPRPPGDVPDLGPSGEEGRAARRGQPLRPSTEDSAQSCFMLGDVFICNDGETPEDSTRSCFGLGNVFICSDGGTHASRNNILPLLGSLGLIPLEWSWTLGGSIQGSVGFPLVGVNGVLGIGDTWTVLSYQDWNGDGLPDLVSPNVILLGGTFERSIDLGLSCYLPGEFPVPCLHLPLVRNRINAIAGIGAGVTSSEGFEISTDAKGNVKKQKFPGVNFGVNSYLSASGTNVDRMDMNGDGLPDIVMSIRSGDTTQLWVRLNLGYRLGEPENWGTIGLPAGEGQGRLGENASRLLEASRLLGLEFLSTSENFSFGESIGVGFAGDLFGFGVRVSMGRSASATLVQTRRLIADVNGDGLPDLLLKNPQSSTLHVRFNRGGSLAPGQVAFLPDLEDALTLPAWSAAPSTPKLAGVLPFVMFSNVLNEAPDALSTTNSNVTTWSGSAETTTLFFNVGASFSFSHGASADQMGLHDANGDGLPDRVLRSGEEENGAIQVQENQFGGANLLEVVHRPFGGRIVMQYEQGVPTEGDPNARWLLASATLEHEAEFPAAYRTTAITQQFEYDDPFYDRLEREFYGFSAVRAIRADGRIVETTYANQDYRLRGLVLGTRVRGAEGELYGETENSFTPVLSAATGFPPRGDESCQEKLPMPLRRLFNQASLVANLTPCDVWFIQPTSITTRHFEGGATALETVTHFEAYDDQGNVTRIREERNSGVEDDLVAVIAYEHEDRESFRNAHILDRVQRISVYQTIAEGQPLRIRRASYDDRGNLEKHEAYIDQAGNQIATLDLEYDATGFVTSITDSSGYQVVYTPDNIAHLFAVTTEDSFGLTSTAEYDFGFQLPTHLVDANGQRQINHYDAYGRLSHMQGPYELAANQASIVVNYAAPDSWRSAPVVATTTNLAVVPHSTTPAAQLRTAIFVDGLGRAIQTQVDAEVNGVAGRMVSGKIEFDPMGRPINNGQPSFVAGDTIQVEPVDLTEGRFTQWAYDTLDRATQIVAPGNLTTTFAYDIAVHPRQSALSTLRTTITDPERKVRIEHRDVVEQLVAVVQKLGNEDLITSYEYLATGELAAILDAENHASQLEYDLAGRRIAVTTPDTGRLELGYDASGNLIEKTDQVLCPQATGNLLQTCSDDQKVRYSHVRNRLVTIDYPTLPTTRFVYGDTSTADQCSDQANIRGRICRVEDASGIELRSYGALGETIRTDRIMAGAAWETDERTFTTHFVFDSFGRLLSLLYPDGEQLTYTYDFGGRVKRVVGQKEAETTIYVNDIRYDEFGQRTSLTYGNGVVTTYSYEPDTRRLDTQRITSPELTNPLRVLDYTYDDVGNILAVDDTRGGGAPFLRQANRTYTYDDLHRLQSYAMTAVATDATAMTDTLVNAGYTYDNVGNMLLQQVSRQQSSSLLTDYPSRDWAYAYGNAAQPNLPETIGPYTFTYDDRGAILQSVLVAGSDAPPGAIYTWDDEERLLTSQREGSEAVTAYGYDHLGQRTRKQTPAAMLEPDAPSDATVYPNEFYTARFARTDAAECAAPPCWEQVISRSKHIYIEKDRIAATAAVIAPTSSAQPESNLDSLTEVIQFFHSDQVGSTSLTTDENGRPARDVDYLPFGEVLFEHQASGGADLPQSYLFNRKELDPETGLHYFGARYYSPHFGRWISADPIFRVTPELSETQPLDLNLFAFTHNNPVRYSDPTGAVPAETIPDAIDVAVSAYDLWDEPSWTNAGFLAWSTAATFVPYVPGAWTAKLTKKGAQYGDGAIDAARRTLGPRFGVVRDKIKRALGIACSFSAGTEVATVEGQRPIEEIKPGDLVLAYHEEFGTTGYYTVAATVAHLDPIIVILVIEDERVETTQEHPFYVANNRSGELLKSGVADEWRPAGDLIVGDRIYRANGKIGVVNAVNVVQRPQTMYNLSVMAAHTFFVGQGQLLVHNYCGLKLSQEYAFNRGSRKFKLTQGDSKSGWTHIWERHIDPTPGNAAFGKKSKFDAAWTEKDITDLLGQTVKHGKESDYYGQSIFDFRTNYKGSGHKTYRATVNPDGTVQTFHPVDE